MWYRSLCYRMLIMVNGMNAAQGAVEGGGAEGGQEEELSRTTYFGSRDDSHRLYKEVQNVMHANIFA